MPICLKLHLNFRYDPAYENQGFEALETQDLINFEHQFGLSNPERLSKNDKLSVTPLLYLYRVDVQQQGVLCFG